MAKPEPIRKGDNVVVEFRAVVVSVYGRGRGGGAGTILVRRPGAPSNIRVSREHVRKASAP